MNAIIRSCSTDSPAKYDADTVNEQVNTAVNNETTTFGDYIGELDFGAGLGRNLHGHSKIAQRSKLIIALL